MRRQLSRTILVLMVILAVLPVLPESERVLAQGEDWQCAIVNGGGDLNIRSGPGTNYLVVTLISPGQQLEVDFSRQQAAGGFDWVPVRFDCTQGWLITRRPSASFVCWAQARVSSRTTSTGPTLMSETRS